jgi:uncharacterized paraquat-inducible protein A
MPKKSKEAIYLSLWKNQILTAATAKKFQDSNKIKCLGCGMILSRYTSKTHCQTCKPELYLIKRKNVGFNT